MDEDGRVKFDGFYCLLLKQEDEFGYELSVGFVVQKFKFIMLLMFLEKYFVYVFIFLKLDGVWKFWMDIIDKCGFFFDVYFNDIIVFIIDMV